MEKHKQKRPCERNKESLQEITGILICQPCRRLENDITCMGYLDCCPDATVECLLAERYAYGVRRAVLYAYASRVHRARAEIR